jgi:hypothetical protein
VPAAKEFFVARPFGHDAVNATGGSFESGKGGARLVHRFVDATEREHTKGVVVFNGVNGNPESTFDLP